MSLEIGPPAGIETGPLPGDDDLVPVPARRRQRRSADVASHAISMRQLGKLTAEQVSRFSHPVPVTSNGRPVAWLVPMTASERRRAEMIAAGELRPRRREDLAGWAPLPAVTEGPSLSEILAELRALERT
jgi:antitoxin (DNA-binding transcriptional repressor) of toxin-antitoxin stability system